MDQNKKGYILKLASTPQLSVIFDIFLFGIYVLSILDTLEMKVGRILS